MTARASYLTTALHVEDVQRSIHFYELLGMELIDYEGDPKRPHWARMHGEGGDVMFLLAEEPVKDVGKGVFLYLYTDELPKLREQLLAAGVKVSQINRPPYMKEGEICVPDPDGYGVFVGQWSSERNEQWQRERRERMEKRGSATR